MPSIRVMMIGALSTAISFGTPAFSQDLFDLSKYTDLPLTDPSSCLMKTSEIRGASEHCMDVFELVSNTMREALFDDSNLLQTIKELEPSLKANNDQENWQHFVNGVVSSKLAQGLSFNSTKAASRLQDLITVPVVANSKADYFAQLAAMTYQMRLSSDYDDADISALERQTKALLGLESKQALLFELKSIAIQLSWMRAQEGEFSAALDNVNTCALTTLKADYLPSVNPCFTYFLGRISFPRDFQKKVARKYEAYACGISEEDVTCRVFLRDAVRYLKDE